jgi:hypothetical protein
MQREKTEQEGVKQLLRSVGGEVWVLGTRRRAGDHQGTMQTPGVPDLLAFVPPPRRRGEPQDGLTHVWIEVKSEGGRLRPEQEHFRENCLAARVAHIVGGFDDVLAWLVNRGYPICEGGCRKRG